MSLDYMKTALDEIKVEYSELVVLFEKSSRRSTNQEKNAIYNKFSRLSKLIGDFYIYCHHYKLFIEETCVAKWIEKYKIADYMARVEDSFGFLIE